MTIAITIATISISVVYCIMIMIFAIAFIKEKNSFNYSGDAGMVSIIIACRNEEKNISRLLNSLLSQEYQNKFEIIIIDDHSTDSSTKIISKFKDSRIKLLNLPDNKNGKKAALRHGVSKSSGKILLFTDADCEIPPNWISNMANGLKSENADMLCGPVKFEKNSSLFNDLIRLEFQSLTGSGASGFLIGKPFLCNGANYAIYSKIYKESINEINDKYSSGDDIFLLQHISKTGKAKFYKNPDSTVLTNAPINLKHFFNQRIRWASKTTGYKDFFSVLVAVITFAMSLLLITLPIAAIFNADFWYLFLITYTAKTLVDFFLLVPICNFYKNPKLALLVPTLQIFYVFYISITAILSLVYKPKWKGRKIR